MFTFFPTLFRRGRVAIALAGLALLTGCDFNFWRMDGHQSTIVVDGPVARAQLEVFYVTCWVTLFIFIIVGAVLAYASLKFRARSDADEHAEPPPQGHGNPLVELGLIGGSVLALVIIAVPTLKAIWFTYDIPAEEKANAYEITAVGYQWWFRFEYPGEQATIDATTKMPLVTGNELVIPAGRPVRINLRTFDVIHSLWIPKLAGKVDMIPNRANFLWLKADKPGYYWGQCAEYCGDSHAVMRFRVVALGPREFNAWLDQQLQPARTLVPRPADTSRPRPQFAALRSFRQNESGVTEKFDVDPLESWRAKQAPEKDENAELVAQGRSLFTTKACITCHTVRGHAGAGVTGPDLTHVGSRSTIGAGLLENNREQLQRWLHDPGAVKPGNKMAKGYVDSKITLTAEDEVALVAYLESLK
ncbi:MAG: cytochrome c oxidase subunit II [Verrucomicrobia bacterium]|nr:cytochrome c oxidase subunit II [Verrucomicrobiota bacterium]